MVNLSFFSGKSQKSSIVPLINLGCTRFSTEYNEAFYGCPTYNKSNRRYNCCINDDDISQCRVDAEYLNKIISSNNFIEVPERASPSNITMSIDSVDQPVVSLEIDAIKKMQNQINKMQSKIKSLERMKPQIENNSYKINIIWSFLKSFFRTFSS